MGEKPLHILHIEDDNVDKMVVERVIKKLGIVSSLSHASNGEEGLEMLRGTGDKSKLDPFPQIILLDINMPRMNGLEFLKELRNDPALKYLCVYVMTTSNDEQDLTDAHNYNVAGYILKPVDITQFESTFRILSSFWQLCEFPRMK